MMFSWAHAFFGASVLLANLTQGEQYVRDAETVLLNWNQGVKGISYTPKGLAFADGFGSLRYSGGASFLALVYAKGVRNTNKQQYYQCFAKRQIRYMLGDTGRSYVVGVRPPGPAPLHGRAAQLGGRCGAAAVRRRPAVAQPDRRPCRRRWAPTRPASRTRAPPPARPRARASATGPITCPTAATWVHPAPCARRPAAAPRFTLPGE
jgi:hypothetical protein